MYDETEKLVSFDFISVQRTVKSIGRIGISYERVFKNFYSLKKYKFRTFGRVQIFLKFRTQSVIIRTLNRYVQVHILELLNVNEAINNSSSNIKMFRVNEITISLDWYLFNTWFTILN